MGLQAAERTEGSVSSCFRGAPRIQGLLRVAVWLRRPGAGAGPRRGRAGRGFGLRRAVRKDGNGEDRIAGSGLPFLLQRNEKCRKPKGPPGAGEPWRRKALGQIHSAPWRVQNLYSVKLN